MDDLGTFWSCQENMDELKQKLLCTSLELEAFKIEANEELKKYKENVKHLLNLLKTAYQERDEARDQLQRLLNKLLPSGAVAEASSPFLQQNPESVLIPAKPNSSISESSSLSDTYNHHHSHVSSPVNSLLDAANSPDLSKVNTVDSGNMGFINQPYVQDCSGRATAGAVIPAMSAKPDPSSAIIDDLVHGRVLPQKGRLLQAVMEAGPLLQTLLVAGPLPRWRNPPPIQAFKIPPVSIKSGDGASSCQKPLACVGAPSNYPVQRIIPQPVHLDMSRPSPQMCSASLLSFAGGSSLYQGHGRLLPSVGSFGSQIPAGKRQRLQ